MGQLCDFCSEQRSTVYCRSDAACLCLTCDRNIHSANALSRLHLRTLVCERCNSQPAVVRSITENASLCQNCDWNGHGDPTSDTGHKRQTINCYSGCPSASELSRIWSFFSMDDSSCKHETGSMSLEEEDQSLLHCQLMPIEYSRVEDAMDPATSDADRICGNDSLNLLDEKARLSYTSGLIADDDDLYKDFNFSDIDLSFDNLDELFGGSPGTPQQLFELDGLDSLFEIPTLCCAEINKATCCNPVFADSVTSCRTYPIVGFARQAQSNLSFSFSGQTGESNNGDYQECGMSSMFMLEEPQCLTSCPESQLPSVSRDCAVLRYKEKRKLRKFGRKIRYPNRKAMADVRKRVKGRYVKAGDPYDYDPLCHTSSH
ncbi:zinc finger protein CONSTANS-LIKE 10-like isoform X1 [Olea europaea var. sylvestris]|uniref:Zinc finger CONSTANS-LIKE 9-like n=1 Tax=Olea europaea subsp. europaea TaxID=158383 RepID=A0A8S0S850_OLEEU|nr:zinc finger protein CONSTANS-LIKE 10-like isoform X1 [Olea europaea var. sylvestris]CAA2987967.1 zinc finger CONSTANS-LIKE 9-like [Olea europaea subsp. europaea]